MFKLILMFLLFILFIINYFFGYLQTVPYFKFISHLNFYKYLEYRFDNRANYASGLLEKTDINNSNYILNITGVVLQTDLKYLSKDSDKLAIFIPVFILHTGSNITKSGDNLFTGLNFTGNFLGYYQYITGGNDYIDIGYTYKNGQKYKRTLFLNYFYTYCSLSSTGRIDAYYYDRYKDWNLTQDTENEQLVPNTYVCENDKTNIQYFRRQEKIYCTCTNKGEYWVCKDGADGTCNTTNCLNYYTGTINLNNTDCSTGGILGLTDKKIYFKLR